MRTTKKMMKKMMIAVAVAVAAAGCTHSVDEDVAEKLVKRVLAVTEQMKSPTDVSCPSGEPIHVGNVFDCTALSTNKVDLIIHVTQVKTASGDLYAEGGGGEYKLEAKLADGYVTRGDWQRGFPNADVSKCIEVQKVDKVGAAVNCPIEVGTARKPATATKTETGIEFTLR
jgi:hypothetical protein